MTISKKLMMAAAGQGGSGAISGELWVWGYAGWSEGGNPLGLGNNHTIRTTPEQLPGDDWHAGLAGYRLSHFVKSDGSLWGAGKATQNSEYGFGNGSSSVQNTPIVLATNGTVQYDWANGKFNLSAYGAHLFIKEDTKLWGWGKGTGHRFGTGSTSSITNHTYLGSVGNTQGSGWSNISSANNGTTGVKTDGTMWVWGQDRYGRHGNGSGDPFTKTYPTQVGSGNTWTKAMTTWTNSLALDTQGRVWTSGWGYWGMNGHGNSNQIDTWTQVSSLGSGCTDILLAYQTAFALKGGNVYAWGRGSDGTLGNGSSPMTQNSPVQTQISNVAKLGSNAATRITRVGAAIKTDGTLWMWGRGNYGQLGQPGSFSHRSTPVQVGSDTDWESVSLGASHTIAQKIRS